jgi:hypothetical protein
MKKLLVFGAVIIFTAVLMLSVGINFAQSADTMMGTDKMMKQGDTMMKEGDTMM